MSAQEAVDDALASGPSRHPVEGPNGEQFQSVNAACEKLGIPRTAVRSRRKEGMSAQEAVDDLLSKGWAERKDHIPIVGPSGEKFPSVKAACRALGISNSAVRRRKQKGMTAQEAFDAVLRRKVTA